MFGNNICYSVWSLDMSKVFALTVLWCISLSLVAFGNDLEDSLYKTYHTVEKNNGMELRLTRLGSGELISLNILGANYFGTQSVNMYNDIINGKFNFNKYDLDSDKAYAYQNIFTSEYLRSDAKFNRVSDDFIELLSSHIYQLRKNFLINKGEKRIEARGALDSLLNEIDENFSSAATKQHILHYFLRHMDPVFLNDEAFLELLNILKSKGLDIHSKNVIFSGPCQWTQKMQNIQNYCEQDIKTESKFTRNNYAKMLKSKVDIFKKVFGVNFLNLNCSMSEHDYKFSLDLNDNEIFSKSDKLFESTEIASTSDSATLVYNFNFGQLLTQHIKNYKQSENIGSRDVNEESYSGDCLKIDYESIISDLKTESKEQDLKPFMSHIDSLFSFSVNYNNTNSAFLVLKVDVLDQFACNTDSLKSFVVNYFKTNEKFLVAYYKEGIVEDFRPDFIGPCGNNSRASLRISGKFRNLKDL